MKTALAHDWLNGMRGGEKCLEAILRLFPQSEIYTLFYTPQTVSEIIASRPIHASFLQRIPGAAASYKYFLPFYPIAAESLRPKGVDFLISTSHCAAKAVRAPKNAIHLCYCFTPMRYAWLFFDDYFGAYPAWTKQGLRALLGALRRWDKAVSRRVTHFVAISQHVQKRINDFYGREADVIYPPVDTEFYTPSSETRSEAALLVSALVPYKRVDLAVQTFSQLKRRLIVIGDGPERERLQRLAGPTIEFRGWRSNEELRQAYRTARFLIFPGEEDFGIVPVEAQACGMPVLAYGRGGALETVIESETGAFFEDPSTEGLKEALLRWESQTWDDVKIRKNAERFSEERFRREFAQAADRLLKRSSSWSKMNAP